MVRESTNSQKIIFDYNDIIGWVKIAAAQQLNLTVAEIENKDISSNFGDIGDITMTVTITKTTTNEK